MYNFKIGEEVFIYLKGRLVKGYINSFDDYSYLIKFDDSVGVYPSYSYYDYHDILSKEKLRETNLKKLGI